MDDQLKGTRNFLQLLSDHIHYFVAREFPSGGIVFFQIVGKLLLFGVLILIADLLLRVIVNSFFRFFLNEEKYPLLIAVRKSRATNSVAHLFALLVGKFSVQSLFYRHPLSFKYLETLLEFATVLVVAGLAYRFLKAVEFYYHYKKDFYRIVALRAISQTVQIFGIFIFTVIAICVVFRIDGSTVLGSLGAITAVLVLVFRDTILGFVTGIHVATSKNLKVGDWVGIPKYNLEGFISDISLLTTKIQNFDKTISTIPTYDLLTTEIKNLQVMSESNTRRIKRAIYFNISSFRFLTNEDMEKFAKINLLKNYLEAKKQDIINSRSTISNPELLINGRQLTNIGIFREYVFNYLAVNEHIDQNGTLLVRQLENTPHGMPLEIYCFTNDSAWATYEDIQADIFDHLLVASAEFGLEIVQAQFKF